MAATTIALAGAGCGSRPDPAAPAPQAADPRFQSAEALLAHYNELTVNRPVIEPGAIMDLMYAENPVQEQLLRMVRSYGEMVELEQAMWEKFGEGLTPPERLPKPRTVAPLAPNPRPAVFIDTSAERAKAHEFNADGTENDVYLVRIRDRWWLSGLTFESRPEFKNAFEDMNKGEQFFKHMSSVASSINQRLRAGELASAAAVRQAFSAGLMAADGERPGPPS